MKQKFCDPCGSRGSVYCCGIVVKYSYDIDRERDQIRSALLTRDGLNFCDGVGSSDCVEIEHFRS